MTNSLLNIVITGASGQVATALMQHAMAKNFNLIPLTKSELNISNAQAVSNKLHEISPDIVINTAAYTAVDRAEAEPDIVTRINHIGAKNLAETCNKLGIRLIHLSTDYVFDGRSLLAYSEKNPNNPINHYGYTKQLGEQAIQAHCEHAVILRISGVFSEYGQNFVKTMLRLAQQKEMLSIVDDQLTCPTYAGDIATVLFQLCQNPNIRGTYHYCSQNQMSWFAFASMIFSEARALGFKMKIQKTIACKTEDYPTTANRPKNSVLDCGKIKHILKIEQPDLYPGLRNTIQSFKETRFE